MSRGSRITVSAIWYVYALMHGDLALIDVFFIGILFLYYLFSRHQTVLLTHVAGPLLFHF